MLHNIHNIPIYSSFIEQYAQIVDQVCPMIMAVKINMIDDEPEHLPDYFKKNKLYERGCIQSPFACKPQFSFQGTTYNDIIMELYSSIGYSVEELHALIAHELGHFAVKYSGQNLGYLLEEIEADRIAAQMGFKDNLKTAIVKMFAKATSVNKPILEQRLQAL